VSHAQGDSAATELEEGAGLELGSDVLVSTDDLIGWPSAPQKGQRRNLYNSIIFNTHCISRNPFKLSRSRMRDEKFSW